jgi:hypothetical protein
MSHENPKGKESLQAPEIATPNKIRGGSKLPTLVVTKFAEGNDRDHILANDSEFAYSSAKLLQRFNNEIDDVHFPPSIHMQIQEKVSSGTELADKKDTEVNNIIYDTPLKQVKFERAGFFRSKTMVEKPLNFSEKNWIERLYDSRTFNVIFGILIFLSLFLRDFWIIIFESKKTDYYSDGLLFSILVFFVIESILNFYAFKKYRFSFVFFLDQLSTLTICVDTTLIFEALDLGDQDFKTYLVRILRLFTIVKIWRATRLFFRKNQIAVCKPITADKVDSLVHEYIRKNQRSGMQPDFSNYTSECTDDEGALQKKDTLRDHIEVKRRMGSRQTLKINPEDVLQSPLASFKTFGRDKLTGEKIVGTSSKKEIGVAPSSQHSDKLLQLDGFQREVMLARERVPSLTNLAIEEQGSRQKAAEKVKYFAKESRRYLTSSFSDQDNLSNSIADYKMQQSGNISKTLSYKNVRNLACFLLLSNLGLSLFLSSIFTDSPDICVLDKTMVKLFAEDPTVKFSDLTEFFSQKYQNEASVNLVLYEVKGEYRHANEELVDIRRLSEEIICESIFEITSSSGLKRSISFKMSLDNRQYMVLNSMMNILRNVVLIFILLINIFGVNKDTRTLILNPLDKLFKNVISSDKVDSSEFKTFKDDQIDREKRLPREAGDRRHQGRPDPHGPV